ncbi:hypothetical protein TRAPUB_13835 [Trametes pubescens]|uniref:Uncharacterized protein n=1 Tax=Trametes pubescens TaxID=154538 RepID=A0A1M2VQ99_TRAPU|nr:hypothetical protein TRAPUB_13835 [Trametes pubescens]
MSTISLEEALSHLQRREDAVREDVVVFDKDIAKLQDAYSLAAETQQWAHVFATRLARVNKDYRQKVKYDLQSAGHNLKHLYAEGGDGDGPHRSISMQLLVSMIMKALDSNRRMNALLDECTTIQDRLASDGRLALADRVFMRKSLPDLVLCSEQLALQGEQVKDMFKMMKPALYVVAYERDSKHCQQMLSARKLTRDKIEQEARPPFGVLSALSKECSTIVEQSVKFAIEDGVAWCSLPTEQVPLEELERELVKYDALRDRIRSQKVSHNVALVLLRELEASALATPPTLAGTNGQEVPIGLFSKAFEGYERIRASCIEMLQLSEPIVETLEHYVGLLRGNELLGRAFSA